MPDLRMSAYLTILCALMVAMPAMAEEEAAAGPEGEAQPEEAKGQAEDGEAAEPDGEQEQTEEAEEAPYMPPKPELTPEDIEKIEAGEVITKTIIYKDSQGKKAGSAQAVAIIDLPPEKAFAPAYDYAGFPEFLPRTENCKLLEKVTDTVWKVHYWVDATLMTVEYELLLTHDFDNHWVEWKMNPDFEDPDIDDTTGYWMTYEWNGDPNRSLMIYAVRLDTGRSWVPDFIVDYMTRSGLPEVVDNARKRAISGGKWKIGDPDPREAD